MATHETVVREEKVEPGSDRNFGLIVGGILVCVGIFQYINESGLYQWFLIPGSGLVVLGLIAPTSLHLLNVGWMKLGLLLGRVVTPVVMFIVYVTSIVPIGLILRLFGKDVLALRLRREEPSYWIERQPPGPPPESLDNQF